MNSRTTEQVRAFAQSATARLIRAFDVTAVWVTEISWKKFFLVALLMIVAGALIQDVLFGSTSEPSVVVHKKFPTGHSKLLRSKQVHELTTDDGTTIRIDANGLHITNSNAPATATDAAIDPDTGERAGRGSGSAAGSVTLTPPATAAAGVAPATPETPATSATPAVSAGSAGTGKVGESPQPPATTAAPMAASKPPKPAASGSTLDIALPPGVGQEVRAALADAIDEAASQEVTVAQKKSSEWFMNFVLLLVVGLFGTKALMGGKKKAEAQAEAANALAERATLQREIAEAKMQVMQAQVEPHFLFNTLASVEYLIETDPPRASAMQRSLIQYLRAVLPQIRESAPATTLGRETDMVRAYLDLLKMRMEERLTIDLRVPAGLRSAKFPPMMLQSLVENAIKHGLERKAQGGTLQVVAEIADNRLRVSVSDDGLGFGAAPSDGTGLGLQSIRDRLKLLYQDRAQLEIVTNQPSGVRATIDVPYQLAGAPAPSL